MLKFHIQFNFFTVFTIFLKCYYIFLEQGNYYTISQRIGHRVPTSETFGVLGKNVQRFWWNMSFSNKHLNDTYTQQNMRTIELLDNAEEISRCLTLTFTCSEKQLYLSLSSFQGRLLFLENKNSIELRCQYSFRVGLPAKTRIPI